MVQLIQPILQTLGSQVYDAPTTVYEESQHTIDIIRTNHTNNHELHQEVALGEFHSQKIPNGFDSFADGGEV